MDERPIRQRPIQYGAQERNWLRQQMSKQQRLGVMRRLVQGVDPTPLFVSNVVLVKGGQT